MDAKDEPQQQPAEDSATPSVPAPERKGSKSGSLASRLEAARGLDCRLNPESEDPNLCRVPLPFSADPLRLPEGDAHRQRREPVSDIGLQPYPQIDLASVLREVPSLEFDTAEFTYTWEQYQSKRLSQHLNELRNGEGIPEEVWAEMLEVTDREGGKVKNLDFGDEGSSSFPLEVTRPKKDDRLASLIKHRVSTGIAPKGITDPVPILPGARGARPARQRRGPVRDIGLQPYPQIDLASVLREVPWLEFDTAEFTYTWEQYQSKRLSQHLNELRNGEGIPEEVWAEMLEVTDREGDEVKSLDFGDEGSSSFPLEVTRPKKDDRLASLIKYRVSTGIAPKGITDPVRMLQEARDATPARFEERVGDKEPWDNSPPDDSPKEDPMFGKDDLLAAQNYDSFRGCSNDDQEPVSFEVEAPVWEVVQIDALARAEAEATGDPPARRVCSTKRRAELFLQLFKNQSKCRDEQEHAALCEAGLQRFVDARKTALAELRTAAEQEAGYVRPRVRSSDEPDPLGWATASWLAGDAPSEPYISEEQRLKNAKKRKVPTAFLESKQRAVEEAEALAASDSRPPEGLSPTALPQDVVAMLTAPSKVRLLGDIMAAAPRPLYAGRAYDTDPMCLERLSLTMFCSRCTESSRVLRGGPWGSYAMQFSGPGTRKPPAQRLCSEKQRAKSSNKRGEDKDEDKEQERRKNLRKNRGEDKDVGSKQEPDPVGWATASWIAGDAPSKPYISEEQRLKNAKKRKVSKNRRVSEMFLELKQRAVEEVEALAASDSRPPEGLSPTAVPQDVVAMLTAPSKVQLLGDIMAAAPRPLYAGRAYDTDPMCLERLTLNALGTRCTESSEVLRGGPYGSYAMHFGSRSRCPFRVIETPGGLAHGEGGFGVARAWAAQNPALSTADSAADGVPIYLAKASEDYDMSLDIELYQKIASEVPSLVRVKNMFSQCENSWDLLMQAETQAGQVGSGTDSIKLEEAAEKGKDRNPKLVQPFFGIKLGYLQDLVESNRAWFEEERWCKFSQRNKKKTMYDVCPELIIPATTCQERVVTLAAEDLPKLRSRFDNPPGVLVSSSDLTLDPSLGTVQLGGVEVPAGLTIHGKLRRGGPIRQRYWALGSERGREWKTQDVHERDWRPLAEVAPIPADLPGEGEVGEESDRVWKASALEQGDTVVLRRGVSYIDMAAGTGPHLPLDSFASHFWGEETVDFLRTLVNHASMLEQQGGVKASDRVYYICTFNNNQHRVELGSSWKASPFNIALEYVATMAKVDEEHPRDAVMVFDSEAKPLQRKWCVFEVWRCTELDLPLRLFCPDGEITRASAQQNKTAQEVLKMVQDINLQTAECSVKADAVMINRAIEDAPGGFAAVHAKLRSRVLDLMTFIGSLAVSIDPVTGKKVQEVELQVHGNEPAAAKGKVLPTKAIAEAMCSESSELGQNILLVAPAGSGKSVFSRALVRHAVEISRGGQSTGGTETLPVRVPLAEMAKIVREMRATRAQQLKSLAAKLLLNHIKQEEYDRAREEFNSMSFEDLFDAWAKRAFLRDAGRVMEDVPGRRRLLILDGFDEAGESRAEVLDWLRGYLRRHRGLCTLLTTRPSGLDDMGMSTRSSTAEVKLVHRHSNSLALSAQLPLGTMVKVQGLDPPDAVIISEDSRLSTQQGALKVIGGEDALELLSCMKPGQTAEVELQDGGGVGAKVRLSIRSYVEARNEISRKRSNEELPRDYQMTANDLVNITILEVGQGYIIDRLARAFIGNLQLEEPSDVRRRLQEAKQDDAPILQALLDRLERYTRRRNIAMEGRDAKPPQEIMLQVTSVSRYVKLGHPASRREIDIKSVDQGAKVQVALIRDRLVKEMSFSDFEIDTIDSAVAAAIVRSVAGEKLAGFDHSLMDRFPPNLWNRPLMANLFAQYLEIAGLEKAQTLGDAVAELEIFRFITEVLIKQAAVTVAPSTQFDVIQREIAKIRALLEECSRFKMNRNERLWTKQNLGHLYDDAVRGHLRLFEPQGGGKGQNRRVQFYHYRIQELLAAEAWSKSDFSIEAAARQMVRKQALVQTGLAPLRFLIQARLAQQDDPTRLDLNFCTLGQTLMYEDALAKYIDKWMPVDLSHLSLTFPRLRRSKFFPLLRDGIPLPKKLQHLSLDFKQCKLGKNGLQMLKLPEMSDLQTLSLNISGCKQVTDEELTQAAEDIPRALKTLQLQMRGCRQIEKRASAPKVADFLSKLPKDLQNLRLDISKWYLEGVDMQGVSAALPRGLSDLDISLQSCFGLRSESMVQLYEQLPEKLSAFRVDFRFCLSVNGTAQSIANKGRKVLPRPGGLKDLCAKLPAGLEALHMVCNRHVGDGDLVGMSSNFPARLLRLQLDFRYDKHLTDSGLSQLGRNLPRGLLALELHTTLCPNITKTGVQELSWGLPDSLEEVHLDFSDCRTLGEDALVALGEHLPPKLKALALNLSNNGHLGDQGFIGVCAELPVTLESFRLHARHCKLMGDPSVVGIGASLPPSVCVLTLNCEGCTEIGDKGMQGLANGISERMDVIDLQLSGGLRITDDGVSSLGAALPRTLRKLILDVAGSAGVGDQCLGALAEGLLRSGGPTAAPAPPPPNALRSARSQSFKRLQEAPPKTCGPAPKQTLRLNLKDCLKITSDALKSFRDRLTVDRQQLHINYDSKCIAGERSMRSTGNP